jgi:predicted HTH domain antitoxin
VAKLAIEVSEDLLESLKIPREEALKRLKEELAVRLYEKGLLGFGKARELAGMTKWEFHSLLGKEGIPRHYDVEDLEEDLKTLEELG